MKWTKPDFQEITLNMEVTAYVNTDEKTVAKCQVPIARKEGRAETSLSGEPEPASLTTGN
jgi:coenzyme PQQ precursor peptide PqqA